MRQCTTSPQKRRRTQESLIREGGKSDAALCIKHWKRCRRTTPDRSIREFAKRTGEEESTLRNILNKGTTAGRLTYWLPDQKKRGYFDLSPAFAAEEPEAEFVEEPPMTEADGSAPRPEAEAAETDTVQVDETADEGEALTGEGALGEEPEAVQPEQQPEAVQPQAETPPPPPQGGRKPRKGQVQQGEDLMPEQAEAGKKPAGAMSVAEAILDKHPVVEQIPVEGIEVNKAIRQFKRGADLKTGVVPESRIEGQWSGSLGRAIRVIEFKDGRREVITGRHRLDLARRNGMATIPAIVYREADGMTVEKAHALDAIENVMDGKGATRDYIRFFTETSDLTDAELRDLGVTTSNNERVRNVFDIARKGIDELRVEALNAERIPLSVLGAIARSDKRVQLALLDDVRKHDTRDPTQVMMMGKLLAQGIQNGETEQLELFGEDDEAMRDMRALAIGVARVTIQMRKDLSIVRGVINKEKDVVLRDETAKRLGITDKNDMAELHQAKERLEQEIREYESPTISGERREKALAAGREAIKREEAHGVQGTLDFSGGQSKPAPRPEPKPEKKPESPKPTPQAKPTETDANGFTRWKGFWVKPGTWKGEEGVLLYDKPDGSPTAFINKKPYKTKRGIQRPGFVTTLKDDRDSAKRVRALYDWLERDNPNAGKSKVERAAEITASWKRYMANEDVSMFVRQAEAAGVSASLLADVPVDQRVDEHDSTRGNDYFSDSELQGFRTAIYDTKSNDEFPYGAIFETRYAQTGPDSWRRIRRTVSRKVQTKKNADGTYDYSEVTTDVLYHEDGRTVASVASKMDDKPYGVEAMFDRSGKVLSRTVHPTEKTAPAPGPMPTAPQTPDASQPVPTPTKPAKPKVEKTKAEQESKPRPFEDSGIINQDALKDPETLNTVERIFANADERREKESQERKETIKRLEEAGLRDVSIIDSGKLQFATIPNAGSGGLWKKNVANLSRDVKELLVKEGLAPEDAIVISKSHNAIFWVAWDESADTLAKELPDKAVSSEAGRHLLGVAKITEEPQAIFNSITSLGHTVITLTQAQDGSKDWYISVERPAFRTPAEREREAEARAARGQSTQQTPEQPTPQATPTPQQTPAMPAAPEKPRKTLKGADKVDDFLKDVGLLREAPWNDNRPDEAARSRKTLHEAASRQPSAGTTPGRHQGDDGSIVAKRIEDIPGKIAFIERTRLSLLAPGISQPRIRLNGGNFIGTMAHNLGLEKRSPGSFYGRFNPTEAAERELTLRLSDHAINPKNAEMAGNADTVSLAVFKTYASKKDLAPSSVPIREFRYARKDLTDDTMRGILGDLSSLFRTGDYPNRSGGDPFPKQSGMLREPKETDVNQRDKIIFGLPKLLDALLAANEDMRTFEDFSERLFGLLDSRGQRQAWEALKPYLQGAWLTVGNLRGELNLDEPNRADAKAVFERVERGEAESQDPKAQTQEPVQQEPVAEPTQATEPAPSQPAEPQAASTPEQASMGAPFPWPEKKNGEVVKFIDEGTRYAFIKAGNYWLLPGTRKVKVWVKHGRRGGYEQQERDGVFVYNGRSPDWGDDGIALGFWEPRDTWTSSKGKEHFGYLHNGLGTETWDIWNALDSWGEKDMPGLEEARAWIAGAMPAGSGTLETETQGKEADNGGNVSTEPSGSTSGDGRLDGQATGGVGDPDGGNAGSGGGSAPRGDSTGVSPQLDGNEPAPNHANEPGGTGGGNAGGGAGGSVLPTPAGQTPVQSPGSGGGVGGRGPSELPSGGNGEGGTVPGESGGVHDEAQGGLKDVPARNYVIPENGDDGIPEINTKAKRVAANLAALRLLKAIGERNATPEEQRVLSLYSGWGNLGQDVFDESNPDYQDERNELKSLLTEEEFATARQSTQYAHYTPVYVIRAIYDTLDYMGLKGDNLNVYEAGIGSGRFIGALPAALRGSRYAGVEMDGVSVRLLKKLYPQAEIALKRYEETPLRRDTEDLAVGNPPYGNIRPYDAGFRDAEGATLHNFFIMKQIEALRPGGIGAFVVSSGFMDGRDARWREWIHKRAQLVAAVRLPSDTFKAGANTDVVTDIVIFRKRFPKEPVPSRSSAEGRWLDVMNMPTSIRSTNGVSLRAPLNAYFAFGESDSQAAAFFDRRRFVGNPRWVFSTRRNRDGEAVLTVDSDNGHNLTREAIAQKLAGEGYDLHNYYSLSQDLGKLLGYSRNQTADTGKNGDKSVAEIGGGGTHPSLMPGGNFIGKDGKLYYAVKSPDGQGLRGRLVKDYNARVERAEYEKHPVKKRIEMKDSKGRTLHDATGKIRYKEKVEKFDRWRHVPFAGSKLTPDEVKVMAAYVPLREARYDLVQAELSGTASDEWLATLRKRLNETYDNFLKAAHGFSAKGSTTFLSDSKVSRLLSDDPASSQVLGLELPKFDDEGNAVGIQKSAIFDHRVNFPGWEPLDHYDTAIEALVANLNVSGVVDLGWIAEHTGKTKETVLEELGDRVFVNPETGRLELKELYLSGDVKTKLAIARKRLEAGETTLKKNVEALEAVQPKDVPLKDIYIPIGSSLNTPRILSNFGVDMLGLGSGALVAERNDISGLWSVSLPDAAVPGRTRLMLKIGNYPLRNVIKNALNNRTATVKDEEGKVDSIATKMVNDAIAEVKSLWLNWWKTSGFEEGLAKAYNDTFNRIAEAAYDGSMLHFNGLPVNLYKHQRDAIWRAILTRHAYFNHVVGAGKTNAAIVSIMEMKRMGIAKKPIVVVPNHLVGQWQTDILTLYPGANVLATGNNEYSAQNRKRTMARIQNGDFDAVIVPQSQYTALALSADSVEAYYERMIAQLRLAIEQAINNGKKKTIAEIENQIEKLKARMKKEVEELREKQDENGIFFDTLGIDCMVVDEAHDYKNVGFSSGVKAKGLGNASGSAQALDMMMKVSYLRTTRPNVPLIMMSGTPVSNSLTELYHVIAFIRPELLANAGIFSMDGFLEAFGVVENRLEPDAVGTYKDVTRLRQLENVGDLMKMVRSFMDYIGADGLKASMEAVGAVYKVPKAETIIVSAKRSPAQDELFGVEEITRDENGDVVDVSYPSGTYSWRAQNMKALWPDDNMLAVTTDSVAAAMDARLRNRSAPDFPGSKINLCVSNVLENYRQYANVKGTQMIFCDMGVPPKDREGAKVKLEEVRLKIEALQQRIAQAGDPISVLGEMEDLDTLKRKEKELDKEAYGFVVYWDIRDKLVAQGIPPNEIAFMQDYKTPQEKNRLFKRMNKGKVRVLIGSTETMGTGVNANRRMVALHHLDVPWRPSDLEQRNGRIIRQGNALMDEIPDFKVRIYEYVTEKTADVFKWTQVKNKLEAFHNIWTAKPTDRRAQEIDEDTLNADDVIAMGMASPFQTQSVDVKRKRVALEDAKNTYYSTRSAVENAIANADAQSAIIQRNIERSKKIQELAEPRVKDPQNWYAGITILNYLGKTTYLNAKLENRKGVKDVKTLAQLLDNGNNSLFYRGFEWKLHTTGGSSGSELFDNAILQMYVPGDGTYPTHNAKDLLGSTGTPFSPNDVQDDGLVIRMDNAIKRYIDAIPALEESLKQNDARLAKNKRDLEAMPETFGREDELDALKREESDLALIYMNRIYNVPDARKRLVREYGSEANLPDYVWLKPDFIKKPDKSETPTQTGALREGRWEKRLREELAAKGLTEADLSPETQAYLRAKREREAALPQGGLRGAVDKLGDLAGRREDETHWNYIKRKSVAAAELADKKLVDVRAPLIKAQRQIVGEGVELAEDEDIAKAMSLSYGRIVARHADIDRDFVKPAMKVLSQNGLDVSDLDLYLQATFAPERNRMIRERAEWKDAGAGISDEEAATRLKGMRERLTDTQWQALKEAAGHIYRMNRANLKRLEESGILSGEQVAEWLKLSPHYVPLRDDLERLGVEEPGTGGGLRKGGPFRKAVGRYSEAMDSSVGWSVIQAKQGVIWVEQNRIARVTLNFAQNHRSPDDYFMGKVPLKAEKVFRERKGYRQEDAMALRLDKPAQRDIAEQYLKAGYTVVRSSENRNIVWVDAGCVRRVAGWGLAWRNTCTTR